MSDEPSLIKAEKELLFSVGKSYELYHLILLLILEIATYTEKRIEIKKSKHFPTEEELNPNTQFILNPIISKLRENNSFLRYIDQHHMSWANYPELIKHLYTKMVESEEYERYMSSSNVSFSEHRNYIYFIIESVLVSNEYLNQILEERSIFWNDDIDFAAGMAVKTIGKCKESNSVKMFPIYKDEEDRKFLIDLFRKTVINGEEHKELIKKFTKNWDFDRIATMDILIMQMAITEAIEFPSIPTKVTLNEYIEIAKYYSTEKSSMFINGILDNVFQTLKAEKLIKKIGRGLVGETK